MPAEIAFESCTFKFAKRRWTTETRTFKRIICWLCQTLNLYGAASNEMLCSWNLMLYFNSNFEVQFQVQFSKFKFTFLNSYSSRLSEPHSPECWLEGGHLLRGCQQWAHSLWPCGTEPCSFSLPMIKTRSPHLVKELRILSFVLHSRTSNPTPSARTAEVQKKKI